MKKTFLLFVVFLLSTFYFLFSSPIKIEAASATLFLSPPSATYTVDSAFSVVVKVNSGGEAINAAEGTLIFNPAELQITSLSKSGSIFSLWTTEPTFSNSVGNVVFGGGTPTSFTGNSGAILTINFKAKSAASAQVSFSSGSVLAADGLGTNILSAMQGGLYTLKAKITTPPAEEEEESVLPATPGSVPVAPVISSSTHPEEDKWYSNNAPEFSWQLPADVTGVSLLLHEKATANPGSQSDGLITSKKFEDVADGTWYLHIKFRNQYGWGETTHRKVLIDTVPPTIFKIIVDKQGVLTNPSPVLYFESTDIPSGIEYYEVVIDRERKILAQAEAAAIADIRKNPFQMPPLSPGKHIVEVKAFDMAENFSLTATEVEITPIESPIITSFPQALKVGDDLTIKGTSLYPEAKIIVFIKREGGEEVKGTAETDSQGNWLYIHPSTLEKGTYEVWVIVEDSRGAQSNPTEKIKITVALPAVLKFGRIAVDYLTIIVSLIVLVAAIIACVFFLWYKITFWRKRVKKETKEAKESVRKAFQILREEIRDQVEYFDKKRGLTKKEEKLRDRLKEALDVSEKSIAKEVRDVEKQVK